MCITAPITMYFNGNNLTLECHSFIYRNGVIFTLVDMHFLYKKMSLELSKVE